MKNNFIYIVFIFIAIVTFTACGNSENESQEADSEINTKKEIAADSIPVFFAAVEEMPEPVGGVAGIMKILQYPELAKRAGIQGRVLIKAFIDETGLVTKTEVLKGIGAGCDSAASAAVTQTKFIPGKQKGKNVKVQVVVPVIFKLQ